MSRSLSFKEKVFAFLVVFLMFASLIFWTAHIYLSLTVQNPQKGGGYNEGMIGQPLYVNPLLAQTSEIDSDLCQLIFSAVMKYNEKGELVNDLAESVEMSEDKKSYIIRLKKNILWHNKQPLNASDVTFTIGVAQDPAYKSPWRQNWQGVEVKQSDDHTLVLKPKNNYFGFLENLTMGILPKHIWENIPPEKFYLTEYNLRPIGSGPYVYSNLRKDSNDRIFSFELQSFADYHDGTPYISRLNINFYDDEESLVSAYNKKEIDGMGNISPAGLEGIKNKKSAIIHELIVPKYFALFLNKTKSVPLADAKVREAMAWSVNRDEIMEKVLHGKGIPVFSPFLSQMKAYEKDISRYEYNLEKAKKILDDSGWKYKEDEKVRYKNEKKLEFEILVLDWHNLVRTADLLRDQWSAAGISVKISVLTVSDLQQNYIRPREYEALLFGQALSFNPDPYHFWNSSQKRDPGLNLALFEDKKADELLEKAREEYDEQKRTEYYRDFQKIITREIPAIFLYSPTYLYPVNQKVKGIKVENINTPSWRFADVNQWYIKTKRVMKKSAKN